MLFTLLIVVILIVSILMSIVILLQSGKGGGLAGIAAGGQATQILGARQAPDFLEKASWVLGSSLMFLCFIAPFTIGGERQRSILQDSATEAPVEAPALNPLAPSEGAPGVGVPPPAEGTPAVGGSPAPAQGGGESIPAPAGDAPSEPATE